MIRIFSILLLCCLTAFAAADERITLTITVTNPPVTGHSLTVVGSTRIWSNLTSSGFILTNSTVNNSATNMFLHIAANPFGSPRLILQWANTNQIRLIGQIGQAVTATTNGLWATLTLSTQSGPTTVNAVYPFANIVGDTNRTNQASKFVLGMSDYATNAFASNSMAMSDFVTKGTPVGGSQTVTGATAFHRIADSTNAGTVYGGGYAHGTNMTNMAVQRINMITFGPAFTNRGAIIFYDYASNRTATIRANSNGIPSLYDAGPTADPWNVDELLIGLTQPNSAALLNVLSAANAFPLLAPSSLSGNLSNTWTSANYWNNASNVFAQAPLFPAGFTASGSVQTNAFLYNWRSTNAQFFETNTVRGDLSFDSRVNTSLANGNNAGVLLGTNVYLRLMGPTIAYTIAGFASERAGAFHILQLTNPAVTVTIANESGLEATAANRIVTGTGADLVLANNPAFIQIIRDGAADRWRVVSHSE